MVSNAVSQSFARAVEAEGVTVAEWVFLRVLFDVERITPSLLAERIGMTKGAVSKLAERLEAKALIERDFNPTDKRSQTLALKPAGRELVPRLAALADENDKAFFRALSPGEKRLLQQLLQTIISERQLTNVPTD
jgi:DNA-binding MarR family transcriptional regulator